MSIYFCIRDILGMLEKIIQPEQRMNMMVPVSFTPPLCDGFREDAFTLNSHPKLLDLTDEQSEHPLALLLNKVPAYKRNMLLLLDDALTERHFNPHLDSAITQAFGREALPAPDDDPGADVRNDDELALLTHKNLAQLDTVKLSAIYIGMLRALSSLRHNYGFERNIIGKNTQPFMENYDGFLSLQHGKVRADILIGFGMRSDYSPSRNMQNYADEGRDKARSMNIQEPRELLWGWLEADHYQMRRCHDIDLLLQMQGLPRIPNWVRGDVLSIMEKQAMKQYLAATYMSQNPDPDFIDQTEYLGPAIIESAEGKTPPLLEQLFAETLNVGAPYNGTAGQLYRLAMSRKREAMAVKI